jgi:hypothetical protein
MGRRIQARRVNIAVSVATFVPKSHTPFQWAPLASRDVVVHRQQLLREGLKAKTFRLSYSDWDATWLEALLARGDRRLGPAIMRAWESGARFDAWSEHLRVALWEEAVCSVGIDADALLYSQRKAGEALPWDHIDTGVDSAFLRDECERSLRGRVTPDCRETCHGCGILAAFARERTQVTVGAWGCP